MAAPSSDALHAQLLAFAQSLLTACLPTARDAVPAWRVAAWERTRDSDEIFWLYCVVSPPVLEAAVLFALTSQVDITLWRRLAREVWSSPGTPWMDLFMTRTAFCVGVDVMLTDDADDVPEVSAWLNERRSDAYDVVLAMLMEKTGIAIEALPVVPFRLNLSDREGLTTAACLKLVQTLVLDQNAHAPLRVTHLACGPLQLSADARPMAMLETIRSRGVRVTDLPLDGASVHNLTAQHCFEFLAKLLDASPCEDRTDAMRPRNLPFRGWSGAPPGVETIEIPEELADELAVCVYSAVHASRSLRCINVLGLAPDHSSSWTTWMAYGAFCRRPATDFSLDCGNLAHPDLEAIVRTLGPTMSLFPDEIAFHGRRHAVAPEVYLHYPTSDAHGAALPIPRVEFEAVGESAYGYLPVLLPGWGKAWVVERDAVIRSDTLMMPELPSTLMLESLHAEMQHHAFSLVQIGGRSLKQLRLGGTGDRADHDLALNVFCRLALMSCPSLEELEISGLDLHGVDFLLEAFEHNQCRALTKLTLYQVHFDQQRSLHALLQSLADPTSAMARQLRSLVIHETSVRVMGDATLDLALEMLARNKVLRSLKLRVRDKACFAAYSPRFAPFNGEIHADALPIDQRSALAFLSVLSASTKVPGLETMQAFDTFIASRILSFAGVCRVRSVCLMIH